VLARTFGLGVLDLDTVTVQHFLAIMEEEAKHQADQART